jgi:endonuclease III related protein
MQSVDEQAKTAPGDILRRYHEALLSRFGPQGWWPGRTRLEVILGAILTQNTAWHNAALALKRLRKARRLTWSGLREASIGELESSVQPAGFYRQKARTIREFVAWLERSHRGSLHALFARPAEEVRRQLLELKGIGPETADAILLYAGRRPFFVADAYTRRVLSRHGLLPATTTYAQAQQFLHACLPADQALFNEFHALLVEVGKRYCRHEAPLCAGCPLEKFLPASAETSQDLSRPESVGAPTLEGSPDRPSFPHE